jgi:exosortase
MINYHSLGKVLVIFGLLFVGYSQTIIELLGRWLVTDESQSHGLIVVIIAIVIMIRRFESGSVFALKDFLSAIILLSFFSFFWYVASAINIEIIEQLLLLPILFTFISAVFGWRSALSVVGPVAFLVFAIPVWDYLTPYLVQLSSDVVTWMIGQTGITSYINGSTINLPYGILVIADGCSGLRYLIISLVLAAYIILTSITSTKEKVILLTLAVMLGLFVNWLRIFIIVLIANETKMQSSLVEDHEAFGWFLFFLVCIPVILYGRRLTPCGYPLAEAGQNPKWFVVILALAALMIGPLLKALQTQSLEDSNQLSWDSMGFALLDSQQANLSIPKADLLLQKRIEIDGSVFNGFAVINRQMHPDESLVPYWPKPFNTKRWQFIEEKIISTGSAFDYSQISLDQLPFGQSACLAIRYEVGHFGTPRYNIAKLLQIPARMTNQNFFAAFGVFTDMGQKNCDSVEGLMTEAMALLHADITALASNQ